MIGCNYLNNFCGFSFHISGSANESVLKKNIELAHKFIKVLVIEILKQNGNLTITFGDEPKKKDIPLIFDYTILEAILEFYELDFKGVKPIIQAILYGKYEEKIPENRKKLCNLLKKYDSFQIKILPYLDSHGGYLRTEIAKHADFLFILGGLKGVNDLINKFQQRKKAIIPFNINLENPATHSCIELLNNDTLKLYSNSISLSVISIINKFCLTSELEIEDSKKKIFHLINILMKERREFILEMILNAIKSLQEKNRAIQPDEDKYSNILVELLRGKLEPYGYYANAQEFSGKTQSGYDDKLIHGGMGELDIRIVDENNVLKHICETFILTKLNTSYIKAHLDKIFDYDLNGLPLNFIIIYSKADAFSSLWSEYLKFLKDFNWKYPLSDTTLNDLSKDNSCPAEIKITLTKHNREGKICRFYHIFINLK